MTAADVLSAEMLLLFKEATAIANVRHFVNETRKFMRPWCQTHAVYESMCVKHVLTYDV